MAYLSHLLPLTAWRPRLNVTTSNCSLPESERGGSRAVRASHALADTTALSPAGKRAWQVGVAKLNAYLEDLEVSVSELHGAHKVIREDVLVPTFLQNNVSSDVTWTPFQGPV